MPLERIYRDVGINDSSNLDSFSKLRISEPSNYDFLDFTYNGTSFGTNVFSPSVGQTFLTYYTGVDIVFSFDSFTSPLQNRAAEARVISVLSGASPNGAVIKTRRLISVTKHSTIKAYISFSLIGPIPAFRDLFIGIGDGTALFQGDYRDGFIGLKQSFNSITVSNPLGINVQVTLTTGSTVTSTFIDKDDWEDRFDGTGPSGITLDFTKIQVLSIEYRASGHGEIEWGFMVGGNFYRACAIYNVNKFIEDSFGFVQISGTVNRRRVLNSCRLVAGYTRTAGTALAPNEVFFRIYGGVVFREDDANVIQSREVFNFATSHTFPTTIASGVSRVILRLRKKLSFNTVLTTNFGAASISQISFVSSAAVPLYWELVYDNSTNTTFTSLDSNSLLEFNKPTTGVAKPAAGVTIFGGFIAAGESVSYKIPESVKNMWQLVNGVVGSGGVADYTYLLICVTPIGGGTTANQIRVTLTTEETYN